MYIRHSSRKHGAPVLLGQAPQVRTKHVVNQYQHCSVKPSRWFLPCSPQEGCCMNSFAGGFPYTPANIRHNQGIPQRTVRCRIPRIALSMSNAQSNDPRHKTQMNFDKPKFNGFASAWLQDHDQNSVNFQLNVGNTSLDFKTSYNCNCIYERE